MNRIKRWDLISAATSTLGAVLFGYQVMLHDSITMPACAGAVIFLAGLVLGIAKVRCPFCGRFLGLCRHGAFCPRCGCDLEEEG